MKKYIPVNKRSKKEQEKINKSVRVMALFNTGTRVHKTDKRPSRARAKVIYMKGIDE